MARPSLLLIAAMLAAATGAGRAAELNFGVSAFPLSVDPHFYNGIGDRSLTLHLYSRLVEQKPDMTPIPGLATSWKAVSDTVWEFQLRPGVQWQDGKPFTPQDVIFSLERAGNIPNSPLGYGPQVRAITGVTVTGERTIRITTSRPVPTLPLDLATIAIVAKHAAEGVTSPNFATGPARTGTGPYKLVSFTSNDRVVMERNPTYWGEAPAYERVVMRFIANDASRGAALMAGDVDLIDAPNENDLPRMKADPRIRVVQVRGNRDIFYLPDASRAAPSPFVTDNAGKPLPKNPLQDVRVRRALAMAVNRQALAERVLLGTVEPMEQLMWPGAYSYAPGVKAPPYDPDRAKALLAEAGYPDGFRITIHTFADRPTHVPAGQAVAQMWARIGVRAQVEPLPVAVYIPRAGKQEFSMPTMSWGIGTGEVGVALVNVFATTDAAKGRGPANWGGYSNPTFDALVEKATSTIDDAARERLLVQATEMLAEDVAYIPLYSIINSWASKRSVIFEPRPDQFNFAASARPAAD
jgi:peptide/nickel transport system substrate-binding protein